MLGLRSQLDEAGGLEIPIEGESAAVAEGDPERGVDEDHR